MTHATLPQLLYVDDEQENLDSFQLVFIADYEVHTAKSAQEGLQVLADQAQQGNPIQMVISDHKMPDISGMDFLKSLSKTYPKVQKILLTGYSDLNVINAAKKAKVRCLTKPWVEEDLKKHINNALG